LTQKENPGALKPESPNRLLLVDGSSYLYRAYHGLPKLTSRSGEPTGAITGVVNMLRSLIREEKPSHMAVIFDAPGKTFRHQLYDQYKANRPPMEEALRSQIEPLHQIIRAMGLPLLAVAGVEADDVIGTLAREAEEAGWHCLISTGDKDLAQLVSPAVTLVNTMDGRRLDPAGVVERFGVPAGRIIDYLALIGDNSDNIPGVPKVGPKTAVRWIGEHGSLDRIIEQADTIKGKVGENLRASLDTVALGRKLVTIDTQLELESRFDQLLLVEADRAALIDWCIRFDLNSWRATLEEENGGSGQPGESQQAAIDRSRYQLIGNSDQLDHWIGRMREAELISIDCETSALDPLSARLVGLSFAVEAGEACYLPLAHSATTSLDPEEALEQLRPLLADPALAKVGQNLKFDLTILRRHGLPLLGIRYDTMLESYLLNPGGRHDMDTLARNQLGHETITFSEVVHGDRDHFGAVPLDEATLYAAEDADITLRLHQRLWPQIVAESGIREVFEQIELPLVPVLSRIEERGVLIDSDLLNQQGMVIAARLQQLESEAHQIAGTVFNIGSPAQLREILFDKLGLPVSRRTPKGVPSTAEEVLEELAAEHELPAVIMQHRTLAKLASTYIDKLPRLVHPLTGRIHTSYHQAVTVTGRLSSSDPNLQNIPVRSAEGRKIRQAFIAAPGYRIVAADYSQIELRIMAHLSADEALSQAFLQGEDIHSATAAEIFAIPLAEVDRDQRRAAKAVNFGLIYGMSPYGLARQLKIGRELARSYIERYFERYPGVYAYMEKCRQQAREQGRVETIFGRRMPVPEIHSRNAARRQYAERAAINAPMQGSAADIIKRAMIAVDHWIGPDNDDVRMIMQVHDELVFEIREQLVSESIETIRSLMSDAATLSVPLVVDAAAGNNWEEAH
jgi:DNA polymerase-1